MKTKRCSKCEIVKSINEFYKNKQNKDRLCGQCKKCQRKYQREWAKVTPEYQKERKRKWRENNPEKVKKNQRKRIRKFRSIPKNKLNHNISSMIYQSLKGNKNSNHWEDLVGYTLQDLMTHLESLFKDGITWDNYGKWHIDHIRPVSSFNFNSYKDKQFKQCWVLENLQPLWENENKSKGNKIY